MPILSNFSGRHLCGLSLSRGGPFAPPGTVYSFYGAAGLYNTVVSSRLTPYVTTAKAKWGSKSINQTATTGFPGRANSVSIPLSATINPPWTAEAWVYCGLAYSSPSFAQNVPFSLYGGSAIDFAASNVTNASSVNVSIYGGYLNSTFSLGVQFDDNTSIAVNDNFNGTLPVGSWMHIALQAHSTTSWSLWIDGVRKLNTYTSAKAVGSLSNILVNPLGAGDGSFYADDIRISNIARYVDNASITVPTAKFTSDANTVALITFE